MFKSMITSMGLTVNQDKDEFGQTIKLLGIVVSSVANNGSDVSLALTQERRNQVTTLCMDMAKRSGKVKVDELMAFAGILNFCAQVIPGSRCYLRSAYILIGNRDKSAWVGLSPQFREDCEWWTRMVTAAGLCGKILTKIKLSPFQIAWDASTSYGIGGFFTLNQDYFSIPWQHMPGCYKRKLQRKGPWFTFNHRQKQMMPMVNTPGFHINYLELFACYVSLDLWSKLLRGFSINCYTDSTHVLSWLHRLTGPELAIPLLKCIHILLVENDIELIPHLVTSKNNCVADALSRGDMEDFYSCIKAGKYLL
jgi:hypothetical protein